jgi:serine carboxypeptidase 1
LLGHLLFIDQPLNVGFSYDKNRNSTDQVSSVGEACNHLLNFLYNFYQEWPKLKSSPLYIIGESYGGRFAPGIAKLLISNATFQAAIKLNLKGVIISSGWIDPINQLNYYDSLLYSTGIVSNRFRDICSSIQAKGIVNIYKKSYANVNIS